MLTGVILYFLGSPLMAMLIPRILDKKLSYSYTFHPSSFLHCCHHPLHLRSSWISKGRLEKQLSFSYKAAPTTPDPHNWNKFSSWNFPGPSCPRAWFSVVAIGWSLLEKFPELQKASEEQRDLGQEWLELDVNPHFQPAESFLNINSLMWRISEDRRSPEYFTEKPHHYFLV